MSEQPVEIKLEPLEKTVLDYTLPPYKYKKNEIAKLIKRSPSTVWRIQQFLVNKGFLEKAPSGHIFKTGYERSAKLYEEIENKTFKERPTVKKWIENMRSRKIVDYKRRVTNLWKLCKTVDKNPEELLQDINLVQPIWDEFVNKFREGSAFSIRNEGNKSGGLNPKHYGDALKSFRDANGKETNKGYIETEQTNTGIYARIKLTDGEFERARQYILEKYGQEMHNLFVWHHELGPRSDSLFTIQVGFERHVTVIDDHECEYYKCLVYEHKQKKSYDKPVISEQARSLAREFGNQKYLHTSVNIQEIKTKYNAILRDVFAYLGKISPDKAEQEKYKNGTQEWYLVNDPTHAIRHSCVHWLMRNTGMRRDVVASFFWEKPETLDIYAESSLEEILEQHLCNYCNPPKTYDPNNIRFCTLSHSLVWHNYHKTKQELSLNLNV